MGQDTEVECWFLIPLERNSDRGKHPPVLWRLLREEICQLFTGWTGPQRILIETVEPVPGGWMPVPGKVIKDVSRKYTVVIPENRAADLQSILERAANSFDQEEILLLVRSVNRSVPRRADAGLLKGHVWTP